MKHLKISAFALLVTLIATSAYAADPHAGLPWGNFALRLLNAAVFIGIIWYFAGKGIKKFFAEYKVNAQRQLDEASELKAEAEKRLAYIETQVSNVEEECSKLLTEGRNQAEALKASIIADAEAQAAKIVEQAKLAAAQDGKNERARIQAEIADEIIAGLEKELATRLDAAEHKKLLQKSLSKVVI